MLRGTSGLGLQVRAIVIRQVGAAKARLRWEVVGVY